MIQGGCCGGGDLDRLLGLDHRNRAERAHLAHTGEPGRARQRLPQHPLRARDLVAPVAAGEQLQTGQGERAGERIGHVGRPVHQRPVDSRRHISAGERGGKRHVAAGERLADTHHIRRDTRPVRGKQGAGPPEAGRDLVEDQQYAVGIAELAQQPQVAGRVEPHAAGALHDRLDDRGREALAVALEQLAQLRLVGRVDGGVHATRRTGREQLHGQRRCEQLVHAIDRVADRHRAEGVAVIAAAQREQARAPRASGLQAHLDRDLDGDRARVGEEDVLERIWRECDEAPCELDRRLVREAAEHDVSHAAQLRGRRSVEGRVAVAVDRAPPRRHGVDRLATVSEPQAHASCGFDQERLERGGHRRVRMPDVRTVQRPQRGEGFRVSHRRSIESAE